MAMQNYSFHKGTILNPKSDTKCDFYSSGLLVTKNGKIKDVLSLEKGLKKYSSYINALNTVDHGQALILPGFFDMHFHWVQDDVREMPKDSLLEWLEKYTFPTETKYSSKTYAETKAKLFFKELTSMGTIGGACYSSIHENALHAAMDHAKGEFIIGNVLMNMNSPKKLTQTPEESLQLTKKFVKKYKTRYCFTPRFAISTSPEVMAKGSKVADEKKCFKQTHLSETPAEIAFVLSLYRKIPGFEDVSSYTEIYDRTGMLGEKSLMGHGIYLSETELKMLSKSRTCIIHCPTSNAPLKEKGLGSGLFDFKKTEKAKVRWALGSDIGGGPFVSMFDVMRSFVDQNQKKGIKEATYIKALNRCTLEAAKIMGLGKVAGNLDKNKNANFIIIPIKNNLKKTNAEQTLQRLISIFRHKRAHYKNLVSEVYFKGNLLYIRRKT